MRLLPEGSQCPRDLQSPVSIVVYTAKHANDSFCQVLTPEYVSSNEENLMLVGNDEISGTEVSHFTGFTSATRNFRHGHLLEIPRQVRKYLAALGVLGGSQHELLRTATGRNNADAYLDETGIGLQGCNDAVAVQHDFTATAQGQALDGCDGWNEGVPQRRCGFLKFADDRTDAIQLSRLDGLYDLEQIGSGTKRALPLPQNEGLVVFLRLIHGLENAINHFYGESPTYHGPGLCGDCKTCPRD